MDHSAISDGTERLITFKEYCGLISGRNDGAVWLTPSTEPPVTTENNAISFASTGDARVDLFFKTVRDTPPDLLYVLLEKSWALSPLDTLKILFHLRDCRGGKGERKVFFSAMRWVLKHHEGDFVTNLDNLPHFGRYKDWLEFIDTPIKNVVVSLIANQLIADKSKFGTNDLKSITLAAKYAPTEGCSHDRSHSIVADIAKAIGVSKKSYRKDYLVPLRKHLRIVETKMCENDWDSIDFSKLPSVALKKYKKAWTTHSGERYTAFLKSVMEGKTKMNTARLYPHEIVGVYLKDFIYSTCSIPLDETVEAQWISYVKNMKSQVKLPTSLAMIDVSGSMFGLNITVAVSLGLLIAELNHGTFHDCFLSFSPSASLEKVTGTTLHEKVSNMVKTHWDLSTNLQAAFDTILTAAKMFSTPQDAMPSTLFIISDMQFNEATSSKDKTNWEEIERKYAEAGYKRPTIVFWNLRGTTIDFPVTKDVPNCSMISGFSPDLLQLFVAGEELSPYNFLRKVIDSPRYDRIKLANKET